jgi:hypothetical protein
VAPRRRLPRAQIAGDASLEEAQQHAAAGVGRGVVEDDPRRPATDSACPLRPSARQNGSS